MNEASWLKWYAYDLYSEGTKFRTKLNTSYHEIFCGFPPTPKGNIFVFKIETTIANFHILSNSSFTVHPMIQCYIVLAY
jgi:hypothetical protein